MRIDGTVLSAMVILSAKRQVRDAVLIGDVEKLEDKLFKLKKEHGVDIRGAGINRWLGILHYYAPMPSDKYEKNAYKIKEQHLKIFRRVIGEGLKGLRNTQQYTEEELSGKGLSHEFPLASTEETREEMYRIAKILGIEKDLSDIDDEIKEAFKNLSYCFDFLPEKYREKHRDEAKASAFGLKVLAYLACVNATSAEVHFVPREIVREAANHSEKCMYCKEWIKNWQAASS